jgi:hypothetical protein
MIGPKEAVRVSIRGKSAYRGCESIVEALSVFRGHNSV